MSDSQPSIKALWNILDLAKKSEDKTTLQKEIIKEPSLKQAFIYCLLNHLSSQRYGTLLQFYIEKKFEYRNNKASDCAGDCKMASGNFEIKVSMGISKGKFNFVQIRPAHKCDYLLIAYHLNFENVSCGGDLYIFKIPSEDMKAVLKEFGHYAHGTIKEKGRIRERRDIVEESIERVATQEYAIRPTLRSTCWEELQRFRIQEDDLKGI